MTTHISTIINMEIMELIIKRVRVFKIMHIISNGQTNILYLTHSFVHYHIQTKI